MININKNKKYNCINQNCPYYFESDVYKACHLDSEFYIAKECIGFNKIKPKMEEIIDKVNILMTEYGRLSGLEEYIIDLQENKEK